MESPFFLLYDHPHDSKHGWASVWNTLLCNHQGRGSTLVGEKSEIHVAESDRKEKGFEEAEGKFEEGKT